MSQFKVQTSGAVTNEPEVRTIGTKGTKLKELRVAVNHDRKDKDSGEYVPLTDKNGKQETTWLTVNLWGDRADEDWRKGDIVKFEGTVIERHYEKRDGTEGRGLVTDWIETLTLVHRRDNAPAAEQGFDTGSDGFI